MDGVVNQRTLCVAYFERDQERRYRVFRARKSLVFTVVKMLSECAMSSVARFLKTLLFSHQGT